MHRTRPLFALLLLLASAAPARAQGFMDHVALDVAAGGGFVGLARNHPQTQPHFDCPPQSSGDGPPVCTPVPTKVVVHSGFSRGWQPALATGLVFRYVFSPKQDESDNSKVDGIGVGVGGHFVFVPHEGSTTAAPAVTIHVGNRNQQIFFGWAFVGVPTVDIPGGGPSAIVPSDFPLDSLRRGNGSRAPTFFAGIVIGGASVTQPKTPRSEGATKP